MDAASDLLLQLIAAGIADHDAQRLLLEVTKNIGKKDVAKAKIELLVQALRLDGRGDLAAEVEQLAQAAVDVADGLRLLVQNRRVIVVGADDAQFGRPDLLGPAADRQAVALVERQGDKQLDARLARAQSLAEGSPVLHVETAHELPLEMLKGFSRIGLTAGASTPQKVIDEVQRILKRLA